MKRMKRFVMLALSTIMSTAMLTGCTSSSDGSASNDGEGQLYYLNFKPESEEQWKKIAE